MVENKYFPESFDWLIYALKNSKETIPFEQMINQYEIKENQKAIFEKAVFCKQFKNILEYQTLLNNSLLEFHKFLIEDYEDKRKSPKGTKEDAKAANVSEDNIGEGDDEESDSVYPPTTKFSELTQGFKFEVHNDLYFDESTDELNQILFNFIKLGFEFYINLESTMQRIKKMGPYNKLDDKNKRLFDLIKLMKLFKVTRKNSRHVYKIGSWTFNKFSPLLIMVNQSRYNYITTDLLVEDSPVLLSYCTDRRNNDGIIKACIWSDNLELGLQYIQRFDFKQTFWGMPFDLATVNRMIRCKHVYDLLRFIGDHKKEYYEVVRMWYKSDEKLFKDIYFHTSEYNFDINATEKQEKDNDGEWDDDDYYDSDDIDFTRRTCLVYAYYQFELIKQQIGKAIHIMNAMFFSGYYLLDELVKVLTVDQVRILNDKGFVIGHYTHFSSFPYRCEDDEIIPIVDKYDKESHKPYANKSCKINSFKKLKYDMKFDEEQETTKTALKYALIKYKMDKCTDDSMIAFLIGLYAANKHYEQLFLPETIWLCYKFIGPDHYSFQSLLSSDQDYKDYILFESKMPEINIAKSDSKNKTPYENYYKNATRLQIWGDMAELILPKYGIFEKLLSMIESIQSKNDEHCGGLIYNYLAKFYIAFYKACFKIGSGKDVLERLITMAR